MCAFPLAVRSRHWCYWYAADGLTSQGATDEADNVLRTAHLQQDEVIRQDNRQAAQQKKANASLGGSQLEGQSAEAKGQDSLQKAQEQKEHEEASRQESVARAQAVVSPFTRATVHRQIGRVQPVALELLGSAFITDHAFHVPTFQMQATQQPSESVWLTCVCMLHVC